MKELDHIFFKDSSSFRNWLKEYHEYSPGIWVIFYKKHLNKAGITYNEAREEALCYGWIDSLIKRLDDEQYVRKFTPRTNFSKWSDVNKKIVQSLINNGRMTEAGLRKIDVYLKTGKVDWSSHNLIHKEAQKLNIPSFVEDALVKNEPAWTNFQKLAPTYKRHYILWITNAKRASTIEKRLEESISLLKQNKKLGLK
jgi:uncharacterized protein YdeI (YjbR/CyaY-like superfamily)